MQQNDFFNGKRVTVMGLGLHGGGVSVVQWLVKHGANVIATDLKTKKELRDSLKKLGFMIHDSRFRGIFGRHRKQDFINADMVVRNPAVPVHSPFLKIARSHGVPIENEATLFFKYSRSRNIIGVTGTRGKSTTAAMIAAILEERFTIHDSRFMIHVWLAGNIRTTPMLSIVDRIKPNDWVVLELSSWHLEDMDRFGISPRIAVVTNLMPDHLDRYAGMRAYARAKEGIVRHQNRDDIAVLNKDNAWTHNMAKKTKAKVFWFNTYPLPVTGYSLLGAHNLANAQAAATVAGAIGIPKSTTVRALRNFRGLPDRLEHVKTIEGVRYYNDTTATTPEATIAALATFARQRTGDSVRGTGIILIAGGSDKNLNYKPLIPWIKKTCKAVILLPGAATKKIKKAMIHDSRFMIHVSTMSSAVRKAASLATRGDIVLLSPAAASFGLFQHEFDRGEKFKKAVKRLTA